MIASALTELAPVTGTRASDRVSSTTRRRRSNPVLLAGAALAMFGVTDVQQGAGMLAMLPGGLFELFLPIWLLAKGFSHPVVAGVKSSDPTDRASIAALGQATVTT